MRFDLAFVILTWNSMSYIENCIRSIASFSRLRPIICVVDNGSVDGTAAIVERLGAELSGIALELIRLPQNRGTTVSRNMGIRRVMGEAEFLCILDSDTVVNEAAFLDMLEVLREKETNGIVGPMMRRAGGDVQNSGRDVPTMTVKLLKVLPVKSLREKGERMEYVDLRAPVAKVGYLMSACWLMRMSLVREIGFLDEAIFYAPEDVEYCLRAWVHGYAVLYDQRACIIHEWQRLSRKKLFSKHNWQHILGLMHLFRKYRYLFDKSKFDRLMTRL